MIPATFFAYSISGLHFGLWIQRPLPAVVLLAVLHCLYWSIWGRGDSSAIGFWLMRPLAAVIGVAVAHLSYVLYGSPVSRWKVWIRRGKTGSVLSQHPRATVAMLAQSMIDHINQPRLELGPGYTELDPRCVSLWPLYASVDHRIAVERGDTAIGVPLTAVDKEGAGYYNHSKYMLSLAPGHQILAEWFVLHTIGFFGCLVLWELWPPHQSRTPWGVLGFGLGYPLLTFGISLLARYDTFKIWSHPLKARVFWTNWVVLSAIATVVAGSVAFVDSLGEFWGGCMISMGASALALVVLFRLWWPEAVRHIAGDKDVPRHFVPIGHQTHTVRNILGTYGTIVCPDSV